MSRFFTKMSLAFIDKAVDFKEEMKQLQRKGKCIKVLTNDVTLMQRMRNVAPLAFYYF